MEFKFNIDEERLKSTLYFLVRLLVLSIPLYIVVLFQLDLTPLQNAVAGQSQYLLQLLGFGVTREGPLISAVWGSGEPFKFLISPDSTGWKSLLFLSALVLAVPGIRWRKRLWGLVIGLPLVWAGNLVRVLAIVLVERDWGIEAAMAVHDYLWRFGLMALVLGIWLVWLKLADEKNRRRKRGLKNGNFSGLFAGNNTGDN